MAKIFKFTGYYIDPSDDCNELDVKTTIEDVAPARLDVFAHHVDVKEVDLGEWDDNHPLNMCDCPLSECKKYFKEGYHG